MFLWRFLQYSFQLWDYMAIDKVFVFNLFIAVDGKEFLLKKMLQWVIVYAIAISRNEIVDGIVI